MVKNVKIAPSPRWMRERIRNAGMRPINNIVDITNYVMLEYGQPMHAFDFACVGNNEIHVRTAREGESIRTLDGTERKLTPSMLCICDTDKPVAVAGVMGGENRRSSATRRWCSLSPLTSTAFPCAARPAPSACAPTPPPAMKRAST